MTQVDTLVRLDVEARRAAQTVFDRPVVVEAGAGTGKTTILVARVLSWALGSGWEQAQSDLSSQQAEGRQPNRQPKNPVSPVSDEAIAAKALERVVAITFTEAAAAEMASRVAERLARVATGEIEWPGFDPDLVAQRPKPELLSRRARALLGQLDRLTACTIHAFCHALLRRHPLEARLHPDFAIDARGERMEELVRSVVEGGIKRAYLEAGESGEDVRSPLLILAGHGKSPQAVADAVLAFVLEGVPSAGLETDPFHPEVVEEITSGLARDFERLLEIADGDLSSIKRATNPARVEKALEGSLERMEQAAHDGLEGLDAARRLCETLQSAWTDSAWKHFKGWSKGKFLKGELATLEQRTEQLKEIAARLVPRISYLRKAQPDFLDAARRAVLPLLQEVEREARSSGVVTFQALLREAWRLLHQHPRILARERRGIEQLLVDEFQDTDKLQCDIVELLALPKAERTEKAGRAKNSQQTGANGDSDGDRDRTPGLFIVGDPKQSIYGWRNADLEAYNRLVGLALVAGGERYSLVRNFRSHAEVLAEVQRAISPVMIEEQRLQPAFEPLVASVASETTSSKASNNSLGEHSSPVEYWISWHPDSKAKTRQAEAAEIEARAIAEDIRSLHSTGTAWKDCALLMRNASRIDTYLDGFRDAGVPFIVTSDKQYFRRREVIDASALIRTVVAPADHVALLTWLRSPIVGVPDAALIPLWSRGFPRLLTELDGADPTITRRRLEALTTVVEEAAAATPTVPGIERIQGWERLLDHSLHALAVLRKSFKLETADRFMERLRWAFLSEPTEGARYLGRYRVSNIERLFRSIESGLETRDGDVQAVLRVLRRSVSMALDAEEALPRDAAEDAVQVMTIHKAKGLEFGHVYLAQLHARGRPSERSEFDADRRWDGLRQLEYALFDVPTLGFDRVERHRERVSAAEQVRTLYVAMTRAKKRLVLVGNWPEAGAKTGSGSQPTYVDLLRQREGQPDSILELSRSAGLLREGVVDNAGVRWRFPGLCRTSTEVALASTAGSLPSAADVGAAAERLAEYRDAATLRMARPYFARASLGAGEELELDGSKATQAKATQAGEARSTSHRYSRAAALAIGKGVHAALESWQLDVDPSEERRLRETHAMTYLENVLGDEDLETATREISEIFGRLQSGQLLGRLIAQPESVVARELPVLALALGDDHSEPIAGVSGTVDLLLRDSDGTYTVVDFKTDRVESDDELQARAAIYAPQLATYARALGESLHLEQPPKSELWFLWPDRVWPVA